VQWIVWASLAACGLAGPAAGSEPDRPAVAEGGAASGNQQDTGGGEAGPRQPRQPPLDRDIERLRDALAASAGAVRAGEREIDGLRAEVEALAVRWTELSRRIAAERANTARLLLVLQRLARLPPEAVVLAGPDPAAAIRGATVVEPVLAALDRRAGAVREEMRGLAETRRLAGERQAALDLTLAAVHNERLELRRLLAEHADLQQRLAGNGEAVAGSDELAREALAVAELLARLQPETETDGTEPGPKTAVAAGSAQILPAAGRVIGRFGEPEETGIARRGITVATASGAQVVAPASGRVAFAGPFRGYGLLLIVEHGDGYHSLLAGLDRIDLEIGQQVGAGEPVGMMGGSAASEPVLYIELRRGGRPIDPLPWLEGDKGKASG
jgi:septal ring factor EnvC (AmiA/AmiB activator)